MHLKFAPTSRFLHGPFLSHVVQVSSSPEPDSRGGRGGGGDGEGGGGVSVSWTRMSEIILYVWRSPTLLSAHCGKSAAPARRTGPHNEARPV